MWTNVEVDLEERDETVTGSTGDKVSVRVASLAVISKEERSTFEEAGAAVPFCYVGAKPIFQL